VCLPYQVEDLHPGRPPLRSSTDLSRRTEWPLRTVLLSINAGYFLDKTRRKKASTEGEDAF
jgi:hypothetical protein